MCKTLWVQKITMVYTRLLKKTPKGTKANGAGRRWSANCKTSANLGRLIHYCSTYRHSATALRCRLAHSLYSLAALPSKLLILPHSRMTSSLHYALLRSRPFLQKPSRRVPFYRSAALSVPTLCTRPLLDTAVWPISADPHAGLTLARFGYSG